MVNRFKVLSFVLIGALLLAACATEGDPGEDGVLDPTAGVGLETQMVPETGVGTDALGTTVEPTTDAGLMETPEVTEMVETPMVEETPLVGETPMTDGTDEMGAQLGNSRLSELLDYNVVASTGEQVGSINALVVESQSGDISYVLVEPDAALGVASGVIAVPWNAFYTSELQDAPGAIEVEGQAENVLTLNVDQVVFTGAPGFGTADEIDFTMDGWDAELNTYWEGQGIDMSGATGTDLGDDAVQSTEVMEGTQTVDDAQTTDMSAQQPIVLDSANDLFDDTDLYSTNDEELGDVEDVVIDMEAGRVAYVIVSTGGFLGLGENYTPIPWSAVTYDSTADRFSIELSEGQLSGAPSFGTSDEVFDAYDNDTLGPDVDSYWGVDSNM